MNYFNPLIIGLLICSVISASGCGDQTVAMASALNFGAVPEVAAEQSNRTLAAAAVNALYVEGNFEQVDEYFAQDYIQHNPNGTNGIDFSKSLFIENKPENYKAELGLMMADGNFVLQYTRFTGFTTFYQNPVTAVNVYRIKGGKLAEHWNVVQEDVGSKAMPTDNAILSKKPNTELISEQQEQQNADVARKVIRGFIKGDKTILKPYFYENYITHNANGFNGAAGPRGLGQQNLPANLDIEIGLVMADGPYVAVHTRTTGHGALPTIAFDIFKIKNGKISEHWNVLQNEVLPNNTASGNSMFPIGRALTKT